MSSLEEIAQAVLVGNEKVIAGLIKQALDAGHSASDVLNDGLLKGMGEVRAAVSRG